AVPAHLGVVRGVQERSRRWRKHATGPATQQASSAPVTVSPPWPLFCQQPYGDIDSADRRCRKRGKNVFEPGTERDLVLLGVTRQRVRQDHKPACAAPIHPGKRGRSI